MKDPILTIIITIILYVISFYILYHIINIVCNYLPSSEYNEQKINIYKHVLNYNRDHSNVIREFNVLNKDLYEEVEEVFCKLSHKNNNYVTIYLFKDFKCYFELTNPEIVQPYTLLYFPNNNITWDSNCYYYNEDKKLYIYPEKNSIIYCSYPLKYVGNQSLRIIVGKENV